MFSHFYQKNIIEKPKIIFVFLLLCVASFGFFAKDFRLDASSETLLIDGDPDLKYLREITERYNSKEFLVLTYTPNEDMISENSINKVSDEASSLKSFEKKPKLARPSNKITKIIFGFSIIFFW